MHVPPYLVLHTAIALSCSWRYTPYSVRLFAACVYVVCVCVDHSTSWKCAYGWKYLSQLVEPLSLSSLCMDDSMEACYCCHYSVTYATCRCRLCDAASVISLVHGRQSGGCSCSQSSHSPSVRSMVCAGTMFLQQFCASAVNAVVSPFVLHDLAFEAAKFLSHNNPVHLSNQLRSNILNPLYQKCLQM